MIGDIIVIITDAASAGYNAILPYSQNLLYLLLTLDIILFGFQLAMGQSADLGQIAFKIITIGIFVFLFNNFRGLAFVFQTSIVRLASKTGGGVDMGFFYQPDRIITFALDSALRPVHELIKETSASGVMATLKNLDMFVIYGLTWVVVVVCFALIAVQMALAIIEFYIMLVMGLILLPFAGFGPTKFIGSKTFTVIIGQSVKLGLIAAITGISLNAYKTLMAAPSSTGNLSISWTVSLIVMTILITFLVIQIPSMASSFLSGVPSLSASGLFQNVAAGGYAAAAAYRGLANSSSGRAAVRLAAAGKAKMAGAARAGFSRIFKR